MWFLLTLVLIVALIILGMGSFVIAFFDLPSRLIVLPAFLLAWGGTSNSTLKLAVSLPFQKKTQTELDDVRSACRFWRILGWSALLLGALGMLIGGVLMLQNLADPSMLGPALATSILSMFYGVVLKVFSYVIEQKLIFSYKLGR